MPISIYKLNAEMPAFMLSFPLKLVQEMATRQRIIAAESISPVCHRFSS